MTKNKNQITNFEIPPADHLTKKFILNPVEGCRSAPTRIPIGSWIDNEEKILEIAV